MYQFRKVISIFVVILILASLIIIPTYADESSSYGVVTASALNIREGASTSTQIVGQIPNGGYVKVLWLEPGWARITYNGSIDGYVSTDYITIYSGDMPSRDGSTATKGQAVVEIAKRYLGTPYVYGGASPSGFDCSGFVYYVYSQMGITLNRVAANQMTNGVWIDKSQLQPGDIVGFYNGMYVGHVGIYVGNGMMIHSPQTGEVIRYDSIATGNYSKRYAAARRIF